MMFQVKAEKHETKVFICFLIADIDFQAFQTSRILKYDSLLVSYSADDT